MCLKYCGIVTLPVSLGDETKPPSYDIRVIIQVIYVKFRVVVVTPQNNTVKIWG